MFGIILAIMLAVGVSGTVQKADTARPGDPFFEIDQAVESLRMRLADEEKGSVLRVQFAEERIAEIEALLETSGGSAANLDKHLTDEEEVKIRAGIDAALGLLSGLDESNLEVRGAVLQLNEYKEALSGQ